MAQSDSQRSETSIFREDPDEFFARFARALKNKDAEVISQCLEVDKKFDIVDRFGNTILHIAATFGTAQIIQNILCEGGDLDARNQNQETPLHGSSGAPESTPHDVISLLLSKGADINARNADQETPLHYAVRAANPRRVEWLLEAGADRTLVDVRGLTPKETAVRRGMTIVINLFSRPLGVERLLQANEPRRTNHQIPPSEPSSVREDICRYFNGFIWHYDAPKIMQKPEVSVWDMLYKRDIVESMGNSTPLHNRWFHLPANNLLWVEHLVEKICYIDRNVYEGPPGHSESFGKGKVVGEFKTATDCRNIKKFIRESFNECSGETTHREPGCTGYNNIDSGFSSGSPEDGSEMISLVLPLVEVDLSTTLREQLRKDKDKILRSDSEDSEEKAQWLATEYLPRLLKHFEKIDNLREAYSNSVLHFPRSLNQSYYEFTKLEDLADRDKNQVITRYLTQLRSRLDQKVHRGGFEAVEASTREHALGTKEDLRRPNAKTRRNAASTQYGDDTKDLGQDLQDLEQGPLAPRESAAETNLFRVQMLIVPQFWLWKIDGRTIITAFPQRWDHMNGEDIISKIQRNFPITGNIEDIMRHIADCCVNSTEAPFYVRERLSNTCGSIFASSIPSLADEVRKSYVKFQASIGRASKTIQTDLRHEVELLKEIDSILDEINMIKRVLADQRSVASRIFSRPDLGHGVDQSQTFVHRPLEYFTRLEDDADIVRSSLTTLLDLRQKEATIDEALSSSWQSEVLFIFTLTTVLYAPLSFASGLLALPIGGFRDVFEPVWVVKVLVWTTVATTVLIWIMILLRPPISRVYYELGRLPHYLSLLVNWRRKREERRYREEWLKEYIAKEERRRGVEEPQQREEQALSNRPTYTRMARKHLSIETLKRYNLDYELDIDPDYILIKRWVPYYEQDFLWSHTREIREKRQVKKAKHMRKPSPSPLITHIAGGSLRR